MSQLSKRRLIASIGFLIFLLLAGGSLDDDTSETGDTKSKTKPLRVEATYKQEVIKIPFNRGKSARIVNEYSRGMFRILQAETAKARTKGEDINVTVKQKHIFLIHGKIKEDFIAYDSREKIFRWGVYNVEGKSMNLRGVYIYGYALEHCFENRKISINEVLRAKSIRDIGGGKKGIDCL